MRTEDVKENSTTYISQMSQTYEFLFVKYQWEKTIRSKLLLVIKTTYRGEQKSLVRNIRDYITRLVKIYLFLTRIIG